MHDERERCEEVVSVNFDTLIIQYNEKWGVPPLSVTEKKKVWSWKILAVGLRVFEELLSYVNI